MSLVWYIPTPLLLLLVFILVRRKAYRAFPCFFSYAVFATASDTLRFFARGHTSLYHSVYWATEAVYGVLGILVMYEVFRTVLGSLARTWWVRLIFPAILVTSVGLSLARAHAVAPQVSGRLAFWIMVGEIAVRIVQVLAFVLLLHLLGLEWPQYTLGIAAGFGLYAAVMLPATIRWANVGAQFKFLWFVTSLVAYSVAVLIWIWFFSLPRRGEIPGPGLSAVSPSAPRKHRPSLLEVC
jgi:hypothetical protein